MEQITQQQMQIMIIINIHTWMENTITTSSHLCASIFMASLICISSIFLAKLDSFPSHVALTTNVFNDVLMKHQKTGLNGFLKQWLVKYS